MEAVLLIKEKRQDGSTKVQKNKVEAPTFDEYDDTRHIIPQLNGGNAINKNESTRQLQLFFIPCDQK